MPGKQFALRREALVESEFPGRSYVVSQMTDGSFQCSCLGWTRHVPRVDCKHILTAREGLGVPIDPLIHAIGKAQRRAAKKGVAARDKFEGRKLRRARSLVKRVELRGWRPPSEAWVQRYNRAKALMVAEALKAS